MSPEQPSSKIGKSVGEKLRTARIAQHYTQSQLAAPDFSVSYISAIERGQIHPSLRALEILAARLGMTSTQLLPNKSQPDERASAAANLSEREEDEVEFDLLLVQGRIMQGDATQAIQQLEQLATKRLKPQHQLQQRYLLGWAYYQAARYQESEYTLSEATQMAKEPGTQYLNLRILHQLAQTYAAMRNFAQALSAHQRCLNLLEESHIHDPFFSTQIYIQMGQNYTRLDNLEPALEMFHKALTITEELRTTPCIREAYSQLSYYYAQEKEHELAMIYAYKGRQVNTQERLKRLRSELHHYLGHALLRNNQEQARAYLEEALQKEANTHDTLSKASLLVRNAEWYFIQHDLQQAQSYAQQAYDLAAVEGDNIILADTLIILGRIKYAEGEHESGSQHFIAGLDMFERLGNHEELADESVRYAQLLEEMGLEREAFTHFRRAFQSRQKVGR
ncbi:MAG TPA: helix-turn-helix transcriptional regulator [Dictyobacter sp.]|jgi:tetratricopeptide (TPR) repeat protein|nr:helix-turn-helix transcriptional regulator [Dictyobacter sp.]